jgi:hypothetical protein
VKASEVSVEQRNRLTQEQIEAMGVSEKGGDGGRLGGDDTQEHEEQFLRSLIGVIRSQSG